MISTAVADIFRRAGLLRTDDGIEWVFNSSPTSPCRDAAPADANVVGAGRAVSPPPTLRSCLKSSDSSGAHRGQRSVKFTRVEEVLFSRDIGFSSVPNHGGYPLGLGAPVSASASHGHAAGHAHSQEADAAGHAHSGGRKQQRRRSRGYSLGAHTAAAGGAASGAGAGAGAGAGDAHDAAGHEDEDAPVSGSAVTLPANVDVFPVEEHVALRQAALHQRAVEAGVSVPLPAAVPNAAEEGEDEASQSEAVLWYESRQFDYRSASSANKRSRQHGSSGGASGGAGEILTSGGVTAALAAANPSGTSNPLFAPTLEALRTAILLKANEATKGHGSGGGGGGKGRQRTASGSVSAGSGDATDLAPPMPPAPPSTISALLVDVNRDIKGIQQNRYSYTAASKATAASLNKANNAFAQGCTCHAGGGCAGGGGGGRAKGEKVDKFSATRLRTELGARAHRMGPDLTPWPGVEAPATDGDTAATDDTKRKPAPASLVKHLEKLSKSEMLGKLREIMKAEAAEAAPAAGEAEGFCEMCTDPAKCECAAAGIQCSPYTCACFLLHKGSSHGSSSAARQRSGSGDSLGLRSGKGRSDSVTSVNSDGGDSVDSSNSNSSVSSTESGTTSIEGADIDDEGSSARRNACHNPNGVASSYDSDAVNAHRRRVILSIYRSNIAYIIRRQHEGQAAGSGVQLSELVLAAAAARDYNVFYSESDAMLSDGDVGADLWLQQLHGNGHGGGKRSRAGSADLSKPRSRSGSMDSGATAPMATSDGVIAGEKPAETSSSSGGGGSGGGGGTGKHKKKKGHQKR